MRAAVLGYGVDQEIDTEEVLGPGLRPVTLDARLASAGQTAEIRARFGEKRVSVQRRSDGTLSQRRLAIPGGLDLAAGPDIALLQGGVRVGTCRRYCFLNVVTLALEEASTCILRREAIPVAGRRRRTIVTRTSSPTLDATAWLLPDGRPARIVTGTGMVMALERRADALAVPDASLPCPTCDLAVETAVRTEGVIWSPGHTRFLRLRVSGLGDPRYLLSDGRQRATLCGEAAEFVVDAALRAPAPLNADARARLTAAEPYLPVEDPEIRACTAEATAGAWGDEARVLAIWRWVHEHVRCQGEIGIPRSALEVLRRPVGMCRDFAVLYAALARAAGIPTRLCGGIVWFRDRLYYHAWAESAAGGEWVPVDATVAPGFVDATHVKLVEGDAAAMYGATRLVGCLSAEILEQE